MHYALTALYLQEKQNALFTSFQQNTENIFNWQQPDCLPITERAIAVLCDKQWGADNTGSIGHVTPTDRDQKGFLSTEKSPLIRMRNKLKV